MVISRVVAEGAVGCQAAWKRAGGRLGRWEASPTGAMRMLGRRGMKKEEKKKTRVEKEEKAAADLGHVSQLT